jgi:hypothetical protein
MKRQPVMRPLLIFPILLWASSIAFAHLNSLCGRFLERDPARYNDGLDLYACEMNNPIRLLDPSGLGQPAGGGFYTDKPKHCCGGSGYNPKVSCCENGHVVPKKIYWVCTSSLENSQSTNIFPFQHMWVSCPDDGMDPNDRNAPKFGFYPAGGDAAIIGPGIIYREAEPKVGKCYPKSVCPSQYDAHCDNPDKKQNPPWYVFFPPLLPGCGTNCQWWAGGDPPFSPG